MLVLSVSPKEEGDVLVEAGRGGVESGPVMKREHGKSNARMFNNIIF